MGRVAAVLPEVARGPLPARRLVGALLVGALPAVLPGRRSGVVDLVARGADVAATTGLGGPARGLAAAADGSTRLAREARRLRDALGAGVRSA